MRRSRLRKRSPAVLPQSAQADAAPEEEAAEPRLMADDLQRVVGEVGARAPESSPGVEQRLERLEQCHDELLETVNCLTSDVLNIAEKLDEARYDSKLKSALETRSGRDADYHRLVRRIREVVRAAVPREASILVVSKGDDALLDMYGRPAKHFPQDETGGYLGYYPRGSTSAIVQVESLRARGSEFLLFPRTAFCWFDHYVAFRAHLESRYGELVRDDAACAIYDLRRPKPADSLALIREAIQEYKERFDRDPAILDWHTGLDLASAFPEHMVFTPPADGPLLPYLDATIDLVIVAAQDRYAEARRVASGAVVLVRNSARSES